MHQISTAPAPNNNQWVIPAIMDVRIPLIENQVIDHTGTYRIVQRTVNGQTGLVIEEYIPEPEPQNNTRAMIIDEEENNNENNNNGQMVLRGQNNVRGLPDSTGETIEGTFEINITPTTSKTNIKSFSSGSFSSSGAKIDLNTLNVQSTSGDISISSNTLLFVIVNESDHYDVRIGYNYNSSNKSFFVPSKAKYYIYNTNNSTTYLFDENNNEIINFADSNSSDSEFTRLRLFKRTFNLIFD